MHACNLFRICKRSESQQEHRKKSPKWSKDTKFSKGSSTELTNESSLNALSSWSGRRIKRNAFMAPISRCNCEDPRVGMRII